MRKIKKIILHCSDSGFGNASLIDVWHRERGWSGCGYHFVITNGFNEKHKEYEENADGLVQNGRKIGFNGAHCRGHNEESIGICLIGMRSFTGRQLQSLQLLLRKLLVNHTLTPDDIHCHYEFNDHKTCPNIDVNLIRDLVR